MHCSCPDGMILKDDGITCIKNVIDPCKAAKCEHFCTVEDNVATCNCKCGYQVDPNNSNFCVKISDPCRNSSCSHFCKPDENGITYTCGCPAGKSLFKGEKFKCTDIPKTTRLPFGDDMKFEIQKIE